MAKTTKEQLLEMVEDALPQSDHPIINFKALELVTC